MCHFLYFMSDEVEALSNEFASLAAGLDLESGQSDAGTQACSWSSSQASPRVPGSPELLTLLSQQLCSEHTGWLPRRPLGNNTKGK